MPLIRQFGGFMGHSLDSTWTKPSVILSCNFLIRPINFVGWLRGYLLRSGGLFRLSRSPRYRALRIPLFKLLKAPTRYAGKTLFSNNLSSTTATMTQTVELARNKHISHHVFLPLCHFINIQTIPNFLFYGRQIPIFIRTPSQKSNHTFFRWQASKV